MCFYPRIEPSDVCTHGTTTDPIHQLTRPKFPLTLCNHVAASPVVNSLRRVNLFRGDEIVA